MSSKRGIASDTQEERSDFMKAHKLLANTMVERCLLLTKHFSHFPASAITPQGRFSLSHLVSEQSSSTPTYDG
jgi:hypothetical protein